jgi:single-stranded DNA-specific DHH superfamily exonuclease
METLILSYKKEEVSKEVILLEESELGYKEYQELLKYGPFGEANPYPIFSLNSINKEKITFSKDKKHLIIKLNNDVTLLGFNLANRYEEKYNNYEAIFTLDKNNLLKNKLSCKCIEIKGGK